MIDEINFYRQGDAAKLYIKFETPVKFKDSDQLVKEILITSVIVNGENVPHRRVYIDKYDGPGRSLASKRTLTDVGIKQALKNLRESIDEEWTNAERTESNTD